MAHVIPRPVVVAADCKNLYLSRLRKKACTHVKGAPALRPGGSNLEFLTITITITITITVTNTITLTLTLTIFAIILTITTMAQTSGSKAFNAPWGPAACPGKKTWAHEARTSTSQGASALLQRPAKQESSRYAMSNNSNSNSNSSNN